MRPDELAKQQRADYWQAVAHVAENVIDDFRTDNDGDEDELLSRLVAEKCDQHDYVIRDELNIHTLKYSSNACAGFFDGTFSASQYCRNDDFPFVELAADAFEADVIDKVKEMLSDD